MEIAYSLSKDKRIIKSYDWYEIQEKHTFNRQDFWERTLRGRNRESIITKFEEKISGEKRIADMPMPGEVYRNVDYVTKECQALAKQLLAIKEEKKDVR